MQTGLLTQAYGVNGGTITLTPTFPLHPGELVQVSATTATLNITGEQPLLYTVWQFRAKALPQGSGFFPLVYDLRQRIQRRCCHGGCGRRRRP